MDKKNGAEVNPQVIIQTIPTHHDVRYRALLSTLLISSNAAHLITGANERYRNGNTINGVTKKVLIEQRTSHSSYDAAILPIEIAYEVLKKLPFFSGDRSALSKSYICVCAGCSRFFPAVLKWLWKSWLKTNCAPFFLFLELPLASFALLAF